MKKNKIYNISSIAMLIIVVLTIGFSIGTIFSSNKDLQRQNSFSNINKDGTFVLTSENGKDFIIKKEFSKNVRSRKFHIYTDAYCKDCINFHSKTHKEIEGMILNKDLEIMYHPLNFLSRKSKSNYSLEVSSYIIGIAEYGTGNKLVEFMNEVYTEDFKTKNLDKESIKDSLDKIIDDKRLINILNEEYFYLSYIINQSSVNIRRDEFLVNKSPKNEKAFFTPYIFSEKNNSLALVTEVESPSLIIEEIKKDNNISKDIDDSTIKPCKNGCN